MGYIVSFDLLQVFTDELYASGVDAVMKSTVKRLHGSEKRAFMYKFDYRSEREDPSTYWMGMWAWVLEFCVLRGESGCG